MRKTLPLLSLLAALPCAAQVEVGDVAAFKEALKSVAAPAVPAATAVPAARAKCAVPALDGAVMGRGMFGQAFDVAVGGKAVGKIEEDGSRIVYSARSWPQSVAEVKTDGATRVATVTGCDGDVIGKIVETDADGSASYAVLSASGRELARSGAVDGTTWTMAGAGGSAAIANDHWLLDKYKLSMKGLDPRIVITAAYMNNSALYRRAAQRRRENAGGHGRF